MIKGFSEWISDLHEEGEGEGMGQMPSGDMQPSQQDQQQTSGVESSDQQTGGGVKSLQGDGTITNQEFVKFLVRAFDAQEGHTTMSPHIKTKVIRAIIEDLGMTSPEMKPYLLKAFRGAEQSPEIGASQTASAITPDTVQ